MATADETDFDQTRPNRFKRRRPSDRSLVFGVVSDRTPREVAAQDALQYTAFQRTVLEVERKAQHAAVVADREKSAAEAAPLVIHAELLAALADRGVETIPAKTFVDGRSSVSLEDFAASGIE
jgi:hypothetical protein